MRVTVVVCVTPPPVPVTMILWVPAGTLLPTLIVIVEVPEPGAGMVLGLKLASLVLADKVIAELKPFSAVAVIVTVPELPGAIVIELGDALRVNVGAGELARALIRPSVFGLPHPLAKS